MSKATSMSKTARGKATSKPERLLPVSGLRDLTTALRGSGERALRVGKILCRYPSVLDKTVAAQLRGHAPRLAVSPSMLSRYRLLYRVPVQTWGWDEGETAEIIAGGQQRYLSEIARDIEANKTDVTPEQVYRAAMRGGLRDLVAGKTGSKRKTGKTGKARGPERGERDELILTGDALAAVRTIQAYFDSKTPEDALILAAEILGANEPLAAANGGLLAGAAAD